MNRNVLFLTIIALLSISFSFNLAAAEEAYTIEASENLADVTDEISTEAIDEFETEENCVETAMDGEETSDECISEVEDSVEYDAEDSIE